MPPKVLIVEDEHEIASLLRRVLERKHYEVVLARNGADALEVLARESVDAIVTDLTMPQMDGYTLVRQVRQHYGQKIAIVVLSGLPDQEEPAVQAGADGCVKKPFTPKQVLAALDAAVSSRTNAS